MFLPLWGLKLIQIKWVKFMLQLMWSEPGDIMQLLMIALKKALLVSEASEAAEVAWSSVPE